MSSEYDLLTSLLLIRTNLYKFGGPILIGIGTVSCILNLMVFMKKNRRKIPCSIYLVARNVGDFLLIYTSLMFSILATGYQIDPSVYNLGFCRFHFYTIYLFDVLSPCYLVLASFDRILITSKNALTRHRSTPRLAYICIIITTLFWLLAHSHALFLTNIAEFIPGSIACWYVQSGIYATLVGYYTVIRTILISLLMAILGLWAIKNVRNLGHVAPAPTSTATRTTAITNGHADHSKDRQLLRILLIDISFYIICNIMVPAMLIYQQITQNASTNPITALNNALILNIVNFGTYIPFCIEFYTNLLVSKTFRHEIKNILMCK